MLVSVQSKTYLIMKNKRIFVSMLFLIFATLSFSQSTNLFRIVEHHKIGYINEFGKIIIEPKFINGFDFSEGLASVRLNGRFGFIDHTGKFVIKPKYDFTSSFSYGIACVFLNGKPLFIDKNDNIILDTIYNSIHILNSQKAIVKTRANAEGLINLDTKKLIIDTVFTSIKYYQNGLSIATKLSDKNSSRETGVAVIDSLGNFIVKLGIYQEIHDFIDGFARVEIKDPNNKDGNIDGVIDEKGNLLFKRPYQNHSYLNSDFHDGLAIINLYKHWMDEAEGTYFTSSKSYDGFINLKGEIVLNDTLNKYLNDFSDRRTFIKTEDEKYKVFDTKFNPIGKESFNDILNHRFLNGLAIVEKDKLWGIIDTNGNYVVEPKYEIIYGIGDLEEYFFYGVSMNDYEIKYGISTIKGEKITEPIFEQFDHNGFNNGLLKTLISEKLTYINKRGEIVWQENQKSNKTVRSLNIDYKNRGYYYAYSEPNEEDIGGFGKSKNLPQKIKNEVFPSNNLSVIVQQNKIDTIENSYLGFKVFVVNNLKTDIDFNAQDSRLYMKVQALNDKGVWTDIEYLPSSWCGNSYHTLTLEKKNYWTFFTPKYEGEIATKLRIELKYIDPKDKSERRRDKKENIIYSNEFEGSINPAQFWNKRQYYPNGIMDPYND